MEIQQNAALRAAWLNHIKPHGGQWETKDYISRAHFHPLVVDLAQTKRGRLQMPSFVPKQTAALIGNYTDADKIPGCKNGDYFPVPNCPLDVARAKLHEMQAVTSISTFTTHSCLQVCFQPLRFVLFFWVHPSLFHHSCVLFLLRFCWLLPFALCP